MIRSWLAQRSAEADFVWRVSSTALAATLLLGGCMRGPAEESEPSTVEESAPRSVAEHDAQHDALPLPKRLAFMSGHVEAGLALYRAGAPEMAAPHLLHPVSETHAAERVGLDALGFESELFETVSVALQEGRPASEVEPQLAAAEANLDSVAQRASGETGEIIAYLMDTLVEEYGIAVPEAVVTDPGEYQDAFGFAVVARKHAKSYGASGGALDASIASLLELWPAAPIPPQEPASLATVEERVARVRDVLGQMVENSEATGASGGAS